MCLLKIELHFSATSLGDGIYISSTVTWYSSSAYFLPPSLPHPTLHSRQIYKCLEMSRDFRSTPKNGGKWKNTLILFPSFYRPAPTASSVPSLIQNLRSWRLHCAARNIYNLLLRSLFFLTREWTALWWYMYSSFRRGRGTILSSVVYETMFSYEAFSVCFYLSFFKSSYLFTCFYQFISPFIYFSYLLKCKQMISPSSCYRCQWWDLSVFPRRWW